MVRFNILSLSLLEVASAIARFVAPCCRIRSRRTQVACQLTRSLRVAASSLETPHSVDVVGPQPLRVFRFELKSCRGEAF